MGEKVVTGGRDRFFRYAFLDLVYKYKGKGLILKIKGKESVLVLCPEFSGFNRKKMKINAGTLKFI
jgi:hypothetical protein